MRLRALVFTTPDNPDQPQLDQAWHGEIYDADPRVAQPRLNHLVTAGHKATVVTIDVPDDALVWRLNDEPHPLAGTIEGWRG